MKTILKISISFLLMATGSCKEIRTVKVTITEENGTPIEGVNVHVAYIGFTSEQSTRVKGLTNKTGELVAKGHAPLRMKVMISKQGYYSSVIKRLSREQDHDITLALRKKKQPLSLYARKLHLDLPQNKVWLSYDFKAGDWLPPHGKGSVSDVMLRCNTQITGIRNAKGSLEMKFVQGGGIYTVKSNYLDKSEMCLPHLAPENGYEGQLVLKKESYHNKDAQDDMGHFFKTRIIKKNEKIVSANYGKFASNIKFDPRGSEAFGIKDEIDFFGTLSFTYYFNPAPNDRNLEFDTSKNLFKNLDSTEKVHDP